MFMRRTASYLSRHRFSTNPQSSRIPNLDVWESVVGLEVHAQIQTSTKLFSPSSSEFGAPVNSLVSLFDASVPGTLPVINRKCVEAAVATALSLSCTLNMTSTFDRKHYFYADLPAGYQITQQRKAIAQNGWIKFLVIVPDGSSKPYYKTCGITQLQLEQDSGKSLHDQYSDRSLIDLNRAGVALMEIVFQPDLSTGEEAGALVKELCQILQTIGSCSCRMDEGALRVDANISVNRKGERMGTRAEVKNLSSVRSLVNAVEYEIKRQIKVLENGGTVVNETRAFDADRKVTFPMRDKETLQDYRFMPEPNLPPLMLHDGIEDETPHNHVNVATIRKHIDSVEFPEDVRKHLISAFGLRDDKAHIIVNMPNLVEYYLKVMALQAPENGTVVANLLLTPVLEQLHLRELTFAEISVKPEIMAELAGLIQSRLLMSDTTRKILELIFNGDMRMPKRIMEEEGWCMISDDQVIESLCQKVIEENAVVAEKFRTTQKQKYFNKLIGLVRKQSSSLLDMAKVTKMLRKTIQEKK